MWGTPLHIACQLGHPTSVKVKIKGGATSVKSHERLGQPPGFVGSCEKAFGTHLPHLASQTNSYRRLGQPQKFSDRLSCFQGIPRYDQAVARGNRPEQGVQ